MRNNLVVAVHKAIHGFIVSGEGNAFVSLSLMIFNSNCGSSGFFFRFIHICKCELSRNIITMAQYIKPIKRWPLRFKTSLCRIMYI